MHVRNGLCGFYCISARTHTDTAAYCNKRSYIYVEVRFPFLRGLQELIENLFHTFCSKAVFKPLQKFSWLESLSNSLCLNYI